MLPHYHVNIDNTSICKSYQSYPEIRGNSDNSSRQKKNIEEDKTQTWNDVSCIAKT